MKIGIITFHCSYNYGSALQAYALQHYLENIGVDAEDIDYVSEDFYQYRLFRPKKYIHDIRFIAFDFLLLFRHLRRKRSFCLFANNHLKKSIIKYNKSNISNANNQYDCFISGSDQIWNVDCTKGVLPDYFLGFVKEDKKKIAYAPSFGHSMIKEEYISELKKYIEKYDYLSVREKTSISIMELIAPNKNVKCVVDPTLLLAQKDYDSLSGKKLEEKYIFLYMLEWNELVVKYALELSETKNIPVYYLINRDSFKIFKYFNHTDKDLYGIGPEEFVAYIRNAEYVVTNSFHATVFSIIYQKYFCSFETRKSGSRVVDLLAAIGLLERLSSNLIDIDTEIDYETVNLKKEKLIEHSKAYLKKALSI